ncbi:MAG: type II secretion system protein M [Proteobacteria bacterium]|nr:type II secretion system protein M [Pseudomonadota bacterium]MBU1639621.1 type II secretion system protein M [Pseudomonadota bacterium]
MTSLLAPLLRLDRKPVLIVLAGLFLVVGLLRFTFGIYQEKSSEIEAQEATLFAQQKSSRQLPALKKELALLEREAKRAEAFLFHGPNVETITSTMQIRLQSLISDAGLEPESLRPIGGKSYDGAINTISIKLRLNGSLENFAAFLAALYRNEQFFLIEDCTLKPDKMKGVKVFLDLKAFYDTQESPAKPKSISQRRTK